MGGKAPASKRSMAQTDERLLVEAAQQDPARFAELYEIHFELVYGFVARRVSDRDLAEDLTSDVFHRALANLKSFEWRGVPFGAWLLRIASNAINDRSKKTAKELYFDAPPEVATANPEFDEAIHRASVLRLVEVLPEIQKKVVAMRFAEQKSIREIAQQLKRSEGAVKQLQFRALQNLRAQLEAGTVGPQRAKGFTEKSRKSGGRNG